MIISHHACHRLDVTEQQFLELQVNYLGDAHEGSDGTIYKTVGTAYLNDSYPYMGNRFNVALTQGVTIHSAFLYLRLSSLDDMHATVYASAEDNALLINAADTYNLSDRTPTTAQIAWNQENLGSGQWVASPDIKTVVQEIVNRSGWSSGNWLLLLLAAETGCDISALTADYSESYGAYLRIYWS